MLLASASHIALADDSLSHARAQSSQNILRLSDFKARPSTDTTLTPVTVGSINYLIPRDYITYRLILTIRVTVPGYKVPAFQPPTESTRGCFGSINQGRQSGCQSIPFSIETPYTIPHRELLRRASKLFRDPKPRNVLGYDVYDTGPPTARTETYTKIANGDLVFFRCDTFNFARASEVCDDRFSLIDGNSAHFFFGFDQIAYVPEIESGVRRLMESFRTK
jgi:hypothetical protein